MYRLINIKNRNKVLLTSCHYDIFFILEMTLIVKRSLPLLDLLSKSDQSSRKLIFKNANQELIDAISEICFNYLRGNIKCSKKRFCKLSNHKNCIRKIVRCCLSCCKQSGDKSPKKSSIKKLLLRQSDDFWVTLLTPLVSDLKRYFLAKALKK